MHKSMSTLYSTLHHPGHCINLKFPCYPRIQICSHLQLPRENVTFTSSIQRRCLLLETSRLDCIKFYESFKSSISTRMTIGRLRAKQESPYDVLGISSSANADQIKQAYRKLALKFHPDINKEVNASARFMEIRKAYNVLMASEPEECNFRNETSCSSPFAYEESRNEDQEEFYGIGDFLNELHIEAGNVLNKICNDTGDLFEGLFNHLAAIGEDFVDYIEKTLESMDPEVEVIDSSAADKSAFNSQGKCVDESSQEKDEDEVEAALAQLKNDLGSL